MWFFCFCQRRARFAAGPAPGWGLATHPPEHPGFNPARETASLLHT
jgi:hypothetical protein